MKTLIFAVVSIGLSVAAQFLLKAGMMSESARDFLAHKSASGFFYVLFNKYLFAGLVLYCLAAVVWLAVLSKWDVSKAYPLLGIGFVVTAIVGHFLGEQVTAYRLMGVVLISVGVVLVTQH